MSTSLSYRVPAKINLYLRLAGKRSDGYNNLYTVFQKIGLYDTLKLRAIPRGFRLTLQGAVPCAPHDNLVYKAYRLLKQETGFKGGVSCHLVKTIPAGSGLGGASADAAYMLRGLNTLYRLGLSCSKLMDLGEKLGADVPLFVAPYQKAFGVERGDRLVPLVHDRRQCWYVLLVVFDKPLATKTVFQNVRYPARFKLNLTTISREVTILSHFFSRTTVKSLGQCLHNDLYHVAGALMPEICAVLELLQRHKFPACAMTGSGPTVYALMRRRNDIRRAQRLLAACKGIRTFVCTTLS